MSGRRMAGLVTTLLLVAALTAGCTAGSAGGGETMDLAKVVAAAFGSTHSLFVLEDGSAWSVGLNSFYQLGIPNSSGQLQELPGGDKDAYGGNKYTFQPMRVTDGVQEVAAADYFSLFLKTDGTLWVAGARNQMWSPGGSSDDYPEAMLPTQIMQGVAHVATGNWHALIVKQDGSLWGFGANPHGELGTGDLGNPPGETLEIISSGVEQAFAGPENSFILMEDGRLLACGTGALGYPLTGPENPLDNKSINYPPKQVMRDVVKVVATSQETLFLDQQGVLYKSNLFASIKPQPVLTDVQDIAATDTWFLGLKRDGTAFNQSLIDMPGSVNRIFAGGEQVLTIYADGKADLQGGNAYGQLLKKAGE